MCGVVGVVAAQPVNQYLFDALTALQHRGQDAAGIVTCEETHLFSQKGKGLVREVVRTRHMYRLRGQMGIGHVRYPTAGSDSSLEAQPFYVNSPYGISLAHNGNLTNTSILQDELLHEDHRHLNTNSDSEVLVNIFAHELQKLRKILLTAEDIFLAVRGVHKRCRGAYAVIALIAGIGLVAFRDPNGIRPLIYGHRETPEGLETMIASESVALDMNGFTKIADVAPGEAIFVRPDGSVNREQCAQAPKFHPCIFEHVYLARPDSVIDEISVYKVRLKLGEHLADKIKQEAIADDIDVVIPVPDTARPAAARLARHLGLKFREGYVKNRYIGRTFIMPGQKQRQKSVRQKLNTIPLEFKDKNVLLVDDSIVRGTTAKEIIQMARDAGAKKVYFASAAPKVLYPNVYGIDMPCSEELIAHQKTTSQISALLGADYLVFQNIDDLTSAAREGNQDIERFEDSVFTGDYITQDIDKDFLMRLSKARAQMYRSSR